MIHNILPVPVRAVATMILTAALLLIAAGTAQAETADDTALRSAAWYGKVDEVERLLGRSADPNVPDHNGWTAMHAAAERADARILEMLLAAGGNPNLQNADGRTPLILAALFPYDELRSQLAIRILLRSGARPDLADNSGQTPLFVVALNHQQPTSARDLLEAGADPNKQVFLGFTPLHTAVHSESKLSAAMVQALVDGGARGDIVSARGETPLQLFVRVGSNDGRIVDALVDAGSDVDAKNPDGESPLHTAIRNGGSSENNRVVEALLAAGADPCIKDASGYIPYNTAREGGEVHTMLANAGGSDIGCQGSEAPVADYIVDPADWPGETTARSNIRSGPGTDHDVVRTLDVSTPVHVTGTVRNTDWLRVDVAGETAFVHVSLVNRIETATAQAMLDEDTAKRVASRMKRCMELDDELVGMGILYHYGTRPDTALEDLAELGGPVEVAEEYLYTRIPLQERALELGWHENNCGELAQEIARAIWDYPTEWLAQPNDALERLEAAGARHLGEEYLQNCVALYATAMDGGPTDEFVAETTATAGEDSADEFAVDSAVQEDAGGADTTVAAINTEPKCSEIRGVMPRDTLCWRYLTQPSDCQVQLLPYELHSKGVGFTPETEELTWSGACERGVATGQGIIIWTMDGDTMASHTGQFVHGVRQGHWEAEFDLHADYYGSEHKGPYVDGLRHGNWVERSWGEGDFRQYDLDEGPYVQGKQSGSWLLQHWNQNYGEKVSCNDAEYSDGDQVWASPPYWC